MSLPPPPDQPGTTPFQQPGGYPPQPQQPYPPQAPGYPPQAPYPGQQQYPPQAPGAAQHPQQPYPQQQPFASQQYPQQPQYPGQQQYPQQVPQGYTPHGIGQYGAYPVYDKKADKQVKPAFAFLAIACAVVVGIGSVLPWIDVSSFGLGDIDGTNGLDKDGKITIVLAIAAIGMFIAAITQKATWPPGAALATFVIAGIIAIIDIADVKSVGDSLGAFGGDGFDVGIGLWLVLAGAIAGAVMSLVALLVRETPVT